MTTSFSVGPRASLAEREPWCKLNPATLDEKWSHPLVHLSCVPAVYVTYFYTSKHTGWFLGCRRCPQTFHLGHAVSLKVSLQEVLNLTPLSGPAQVCPLVNGILSGLDVTLVHNIAGKSPPPLKKDWFPPRSFVPAHHGTAGPCWPHLSFGCIFVPINC